MIYRWEMAINLAGGEVGIRGFGIRANLRGNAERNFRANKKLHASMNVRLAGGLELELTPRAALYFFTDRGALDLHKISQLGPIGFLRFLAEPQNRHLRALGLRLRRLGQLGRIRNFLETSTGLVPGQARLGRVFRQLSRPPTRRPHVRRGLYAFDKNRTGSMVNPYYRR